MSIIRIEHNKANPYVMLNKSALEEPTMSFEAKGLWAFLMSRPDNWNVSVTHIAKTFRESKSRKLGEEGVLSILNELIKFGYCQREQPKKEGGKFGRMDYRIFEHPMQMVFHSEKPTQDEYEPQPSQPFTAVPPTNKQCIKTNIEKDNVLRDGGNVHKSNPSKKTLPSSIDSKKTVDASRRWRLSEEQTDAYNFLESSNIDTDPGTMAYWAKTYTLERIIDVYNEAKSHNPTSIARYMQKLLKTHANVSKGFAASNKDFAEEFKKNNSWNQLNILKKYCTYPVGKTNSDLSYNLEPEQFAIMLMNAFNRRS